MRNDRILPAEGDSQTLREKGGFPTLKSGPDKNVVNSSKAMTCDIRRPLMAIVATLKLLNRGYYGKMDEQAAEKVREVLSNATRLTRMADEYLEKFFPEPKNHRIKMRQPQP